MPNLGSGFLWFWQFRFFRHGTEYIFLVGKRRRIFYFLRRIYFLMSLIISYLVYISLDYPMESLMYPDIFYPLALGFTKKWCSLFYFSLFFARGTCIFNLDNKPHVKPHVLMYIYCKSIVGFCLMAVIKFQSLSRQLRFLPLAVITCQEVSQKKAVCSPCLFD